MRCFITIACILAATIAFAKGDTPTPMLPTPTPEQLAWQDTEIGMFIHFAPNTWQDQEGDDLSTPLDKINPTKLDTDQWVRVAESMGAKYIVFVAKHVGGFCMWQTETTDYSIGHTAWRGGKGDVLRDLSESCRKRGMKLGVYISPCDGKHGVGVGGQAKTPEEQEKYNPIYREQLTEVLSRYGSMFEVWFDGGNIIEVGDILHKYAPHATVFQGKYTTIRWVGNEDGVAPYPSWNAVPSDANACGVPVVDGKAWLPFECDCRIRRDWFWSSKNADTLKSVNQLMDMYYASVGHGSVLLLNNTPDTTGLIPAADAKRAAEFGAEIRRRFGKSLAETTGKGEHVDLALPHPAVIDHIITMEDIAHGERVQEYVIKGEVGGHWQELCRGTAIGHKKIDRFAPVEVNKVRLYIEESTGEPIIRKLAVYHVGA
jgi:alpha-L-fucosidase